MNSSLRPAVIQPRGVCCSIVSKFLANCLWLPRRDIAVSTGQRVTGCVEANFSQDQVSREIAKIIQEEVRRDQLWRLLRTVDADNANCDWKGSLEVGLGRLEDRPSRLFKMPEDPEARRSPVRS
jgi:hypothetical protein